MFEITIYHFISLIVLLGGLQYWVISKILSNIHDINALKSADEKQEKKDLRKDEKQENLNESINKIFLELKEISLRLETMDKFNERLEKAETRINYLEKQDIKHSLCPLFENKNDLIKIIKE